MATVFKGGRLPMAAACLAILFTIGITAWSQSSPIKIVLTGDSVRYPSLHPFHCVVSERKVVLAAGLHLL